MSFCNSVCYFMHASRPLMKHFKWRAVFLAKNLETLGTVHFFGSWPLQYKMLSAGPKSALFWETYLTVEGIGTVLGTLLGRVYIAQLVLLQNSLTLSLNCPCYWRLKIQYGYIIYRFL